LIISSRISKPTLYDGLFEYGSKITNDFETSTKVPLIKYTPVSTPNADPIAVAFSATRVKMDSPAFNVVLP
tara:strand:+ start:878 stop:1090 length:213 start_codon:yes stop_codon:yes gene_type:complete